MISEKEEHLGLGHP